jgi:hypothetical protein
MITIGPATPEELEKFQKYRAPSASVPGTETNGGFEDPDHQWMFEN